MFWVRSSSARGGPYSRREEGIAGSTQAKLAATFAASTQEVGAAKKIRAATDDAQHEGVRAKEPIHFSLIMRCTLVNRREKSMICDTHSRNASSKGAAADVRHAREFAENA